MAPPAPPLPPPPLLHRHHHHLGLGLGLLLLLDSFCSLLRHRRHGAVGSYGEGNGGKG